MILRAQYELILETISKAKVMVLTAPKGLDYLDNLLRLLQEKNRSFALFSMDKIEERKRIEQLDVAQLGTLFSQPITLLHESQFLSMDVQKICDAVLNNEIKTTLVFTGTFLPPIDEYLLEALRMEGQYIHLQFPTFYELAQQNSLPTEDQRLPQRIIYGNTLDIHQEEEFIEKQLLTTSAQLFQTHLGRGERINKADQLTKVLRQLAFHIGEVVTYNQVASECGIDNETVERYIEILIKSFWIIRLPSFSNGQRYELRKSHQFYFTDVGIRNALIKNFNPIDLRNDQAALWKNWVIAERIKWNAMNNPSKDYFFWKTHTNQQIDFIEVDQQTGSVDAFQTLWDKRKSPKIPKAFSNAYPNIKTHVVNRSTYWRFLAQKSKP
jgi:hypothetical protein